jgi:hypothetical protein
LTLQASLASPQYTKLRSPSYAGDSYVTLFSDRVVFKCLVNTDLTSAGSWAQFNYNTVTTGAYTDVFVGMEVFISATSNIKDSTFIGRIRVAPSSSVLYVNESSLNFSVGATVWVVDNHVPQYRLSRPSTSDPATAVELIDYDQTFQQLAPQTVGIKTAYIGRVNSSGKLRIGIDAASSYAGTSGATISTYLWTLDGTYIAGSSSASRIIVDVDAGEQWGSLLLTDSGGRTSLRWFAIRAHDENDPPNVYGSNISITGNIDQGWTASVPFFAGVDDVLPNAFAIVWRDFEAYKNYEGNLWGGGSATITAKARSSNVVTLTAANSFQAGQQVIVISSDSAFNGTFTVTAATSTTFSYAQTAGNVGSTSATGTAVVNAQNVEFVGWWQQEDEPVSWDSDAAALETANFQFTGVAARMQRMTSQLLGFSLNSSPTLWGEMVSMTPWRAMLHFLQRYTTIADLCDITFDSTDNTYVFPSLSAQGGNAMESVRGIARQINANPEFAPWGAIQIVREVGQLDSDARAALPTIASWDMQDIISPGGITRSIEPLPTIGKVDADGGGYNTTLSQVIVYTARAPGTAQGDGSGSAQLSAQIMPASATSADTLTILRQRVGNQLLIENNQEYLDVDHPDGYVGVPFVPSQAQLYTWTLDSDMVGDNNVNRIVYTTSAQWVVENVTINYSSEGLRTLKVRYHRVTPIGALGDDTTQIIPAPGEIPPLPDPGLPGFDFEPIDILYPDDPVPGALPPLPDRKIATFKGQELIVTSPTQAWWLQNFVTYATPTALNITPSDLDDFEIVQPALSAFYTDTAIPLWLLGTDGTDSKVWYTANGATLSAAWSAGTTTAGVYTVIRATQTDGTLMCYSPSATGGTTTLTYDFTTGQRGWSVVNDAGFNPTNLGFYTSGTGFTQNSEDGVAFPDNRFANVAIELTLASVTITDIVVYYTSLNKGNDDDPLAENPQGLIYINGVLVDTNNNLPAGTGTYSWSGSSAATSVKTFLDIGFRDDTVDCTGTGTIYKIEITATGIASGDASVVYSTDNGNTLSFPISVGATPGAVGGFDVSRSSGVSYAAADGGLYKASTLGGAYSLFYTITGGAQCVACCIPYFDWDGVKQTTSSTPDVIIALDQLDGSSRSLIWVEGDGVTLHNLTPTAGMTFSKSNCITSSYNHHIAVFGDVSGTDRLYITLNKGVGWTNVSALTSPTFIRCRRNDASAATSGSSKGQLYVMANSVARYTSKWATNGTFPRNMPDNTLTSMDTVY